MLKKLLLILFLLVSNNVFALQPLSKILSDEEYEKFNKYKSNYKEEYIKNQNWELNDFIGYWIETHPPRRADDWLKLSKNLEIYADDIYGKCKVQEFKNNELFLNCSDGKFVYEIKDDNSSYLKQDKIVAEFYVKMRLYYDTNYHTDDKGIILYMAVDMSNDSECFTTDDECPYHEGYFNKVHPDDFPFLPDDREKEARAVNGIFKEVGPDEVCPANLPLREEDKVNGKITSIKCYPCDTNYLQLLDEVVDCSVCPNLYKLGRNCMYKDFSNMDDFYINYQNKQAVELCEESKTHILVHNADNKEVSCDRRIAGFDCLKASSVIEHLICDNHSLGFYDKKLTKLYNEATGQQDEQKKWLQKRDRCGLDIDCLKRAYKDRIEELFNYNYINGVYNK